jgi:very-short-patch-repair endonuclease
LLDFAVHCQNGHLDIETDGDMWHADPKRIPKDNMRDNDLATKGWRLLRLNSVQVKEQMADYCLPTITEMINSLGGLDEGRPIGRRVSADPDGPRQLGLFDGLSS